MDKQLNDAGVHCVEWVDQIPFCEHKFFEQEA